MLNKKLIKDALEVSLTLAHRGSSLRSGYASINPRNAEVLENSKREYIELLTNFERDWKEMEDSVSAQQQLTTQKRELEQQLQQAQAKVNDYHRLQTNLTTCQREGERLKKEKTELTNQISALQTQLTTQTKEANRLKNLSKHNSNLYQEQKAEINRLKKVEKELSGQQRELKNQVKKKLAEWVKLVREREIKEIKKGWFW